MLAEVFSCKEYDDDTKNYGDCFAFWDNMVFIVYDCGSVEHAMNLINFMNDNNINKIDYLVLSHDDSDHVSGVQYLLDNTNVNKICTPLILKYIDEIYAEIKKNSPQTNIEKDTVRERIIEAYSNIYNIGDRLPAGKLIDATDGIQLADNFKILGPSKDLLVAVVAKGINGYEGDTYYKETVSNAISVQAVVGDRNTIFLCGDAAFECVKENLNNNYTYIQAAHHGKLEFAQSVYELKKGQEQSLCFIISDNTGNQNGGSDNFREQLKQCRRKTTKEGRISINLNLPQQYRNWGKNSAIYYF